MIRSPCGRRPTASATTSVGSSSTPITSTARSTTGTEPPLALRRPAQRSTVTAPRRCRPHAGTGAVGARGAPSLRAGVVLASELSQELVALRRSVGVLRHDLLEEGRDLLLFRVAGIAHVLAVVVARLERVVLHGDQVEGDIVESGLSSRHGGLLAGRPDAGAGARAGLPSRVSLNCSSGSPVYQPPHGADNGVERTVRRPPSRPR